MRKQVGFHKLKSQANLSEASSLTHKKLSLLVYFTAPKAEDEIVGSRSWLSANERPKSVVRRSSSVTLIWVLFGPRKLL